MQAAGFSSLFSCKYTCFVCNVAVCRRAFFAEVHSTVLLFPVEKLLLLLLLLLFLSFVWPWGEGGGGSGCEVVNFATDLF